MSEIKPDAWYDPHCVDCRREFTQANPAIWIRAGNMAVCRECVAHIRAAQADYFTREDVGTLREVAEDLDLNQKSRILGWQSEEEREEIARLRRLADRIEALLPPPTDLTKPQTVDMIVTWQPKTP